MMATNQATKLMRFGTALQDGVVAVEIGPERVKHYVHKALLEEHSEYFKKALNGPWKEAEDKVVCLDDVDCCTFEVFANWLYTGKLPDTDEEWNREEYEYSLQWYATADLNMVKACAFAHRMFAPRLYKALEHSIVNEHVGGIGRPYYAAAIYAFAHLPPTSPVLRVMIDAQCRGLDVLGDTAGNGQLVLRPQLPNAFLVGVMVKLTELNAEKETRLENYGCYKHGWEMKRCDYHDHATETERKECEKAASREVSSESRDSGAGSSSSN